MIEQNGPGNPFAPPSAIVQDAPARTGELAGRGVRLVAAILDGVFFGLLAFVIGLVTAVNIWSPTQVGTSAYWFSYAVTLVVDLALQGVLLHLRSQTLGKVVMGIRIVRRDGSRASVVRLLGLRLVPMMLVGIVPKVGPVLSLIDSLLIFRESRRCLHDDIADTVVVRA